ncbi:MAG: aminotransferase class V-fold PLP-dependent enzyme, partial [Elsteraceae bacterium]
FVDAGQVLGQWPVDVAQIGCDMLKGAGRKFLRGPRGTALLYLRQDFLPQLTPAFLDVQSAPWSGEAGVMRSDARRFETSETPVALWLGLGAALSLARELGVDRIRRRIAPLADHLRAGLGRVPGVTLQDLGGPERSGLVSFAVAGIAGSAVKERLAAEHHISVAANGVPYTPHDMRARGLSEIVRASVSYLNTEEEVERLIKAVRAVAVSRS